MNDAGSQADTITALRSKMQFGRPNWTQIFGDIRNGIETGAYLPGRESMLKTNVVPLDDV